MALKYSQYAAEGLNRVTEKRNFAAKQIYLYPNFSIYMSATLVREMKMKKAASYTTMLDRNLIQQVMFTPRCYNHSSDMCSI